jgi:hypothetical protein
MIATDSGGNVYVAGAYGIGTLTFYDTTDVSNAYTKTLTSTTADGFVAKYSTDGVPAWVARITSTSSNDVANAMAVDAFGNVFVGGYYGADVTFYSASGSASYTLTWTSTSVAATTDAFIVKYDTNGLWQWSAQIASTSNDYINSVAADPSGNVIVTGSYAGALAFYNTGSTQASLTLPLTTGTVNSFVAKYTTAGTVSWVAQLSGSGATNSASGVASDPFGNVIVSGTYTGSPLTIYNSSGVSNASLLNSGDQDAFIVKYTPSGGFVWAARVASANRDYGGTVVTDAAGNIFMNNMSINASLGVTFYNSSGTTFTTLTGTANQDVYLIKYSPAGSVLWVARLSSTGNEWSYGLTVDSSGNPIISGSSASNITFYNSDGTAGAGPFTNPGTAIMGWVAKYSSTGSVLWASQQYSTGTTTSVGAATDSSGYVYAGLTYTANIIVSNAV